MNLIAQTVSIPDANFLSFLKNNYASVINASNQLIVSEAEKITGNFYCNNQGISSLEGIQYFKNISKLYAYDNGLTYLPNIQSLTLLENLQLQRNNLTTIPSLAQLKFLRILLLYENQLTSIPDLTGCDQLNQLVVYRNQISILPNLNAYKNLIKIDVGENKITSFPNIDSLSNLEIFITYKNKLTTIPSLKRLTKLTKINFGYNQLTSFPDISNNTLLTDLSVDNNNLRKIPSLLVLTALSVVELHNNYFSYNDLYNVSLHPNYSSSFVLFNQKDQPQIDTLLYVGSDMEFKSAIDPFTPNTTYQWFKNGVNITNATSYNLILPNVSITDSASYTCVVKNSNFTGISMLGANYFLRVLNCPKPSDIVIYRTKDITCEENGYIDVGLKNLVNDSVRYTLTSKSTNTIFTNSNGRFNDLNEQTYSLQIKTSPSCVVNYPNTIVLNKATCKEVYLTPNGDGDHDTYSFETTGTVSIYNKNGVLVNKFTSPFVWEGTDFSGKMVDIGLYFVYQNNEKKSIQISVIY